MTDPDSNLIRYIGVTRNTLSGRLSGHLWDARRSGKKTHKCYWIRKLLSEGSIPKIFEVAVFNTPEAAYTAEMEWIHLHRLMGCSLVNTTDGGEGIWNRSGEIGAKIVATRRANGSYNISEETRRRMSIAVLSRPPFSKERRRSLCRVATTELEQAIIENYKNGESALQISKDLNVSRSVIFGALDREDIQKRSKTEASQLIASKPEFLNKMKLIGEQIAQLPQLDRMKKYGNKRRLPINIQNRIIEIFKDNPKISLREIGRKVGTAHGPVSKVLMVHGLIEKRSRNKP